MKLSMTIKKILVLVVFGFFVLAPRPTFAVLGVGSGPGGIVNTDPVPLQFAPPCIPVKGVAGLDTCGTPITSTSPIQDYLIRLYQFAVGISGIVAVGMIVWGAIKISLFTESITQKSEGREMITNAIVGIVLLLGSYLILRTVNPRIVSLGEMLSSSTVPTNTTATSSLEAPPEICAAPNTIPGPNGSPIGNSDPDASSTCAYRKLFIYKDGFTVSANDSAYYNYLTDLKIAPNSLMWVYPYYVKNQGVSSAKCLVYAYRQQGDKGSTFVDLQPTLQACVLDPKTPQQPGYAKTGIATGLNIPSSTQALADALISSEYLGALSFSNNASCKPAETRAAGVITAMAQGKAPLVCHNGCSTDGVECTQTGAYLNEQILRALIGFAKTGGTATITSITGGDHASNSAHYTGSAIDMTIGGGVSAYNTAITKLNSLGLSAYCEYSTGGIVKLHTTCGADAANDSNIHLHVQSYPNGNAIP